MRAIGTAALLAGAESTASQHFSDRATRQQNLYGNVMYIHSRFLQVGFELAQLRVGFKGDSRADNEAWVFHNKIIFTF